jgi:hypothetical protein
VRYCFFTPARCVVQNAVVGVVKEQTQPAVAQGRVALQVPPQVGTVAATLRNCRAETVPAQRTATEIAVRNIFSILLPMIVFLSVTNPNLLQIPEDE